MKKKEQNRTLKEIRFRPLSLFNPLDYLRLLWWSLVIPQKLMAYWEAFDQEAAKSAGKWLVSTLTWLPLLLPTLTLWLEFLPDSVGSHRIYLGLNVILLFCWFLTGRLGHLDKIKGIADDVVIFMAIAVAVSVAANIALMLSIAEAMLVIVLLLLLVSVAFVVAVGVLDSVAVGIAFGVMVGVAIVMVFTIAVSVVVAVMILVGIGILGILGFVVGAVVGMALGIVASIIVGRIMINVAETLENSLKNGIASFSTRLAFMLLVSAYFFLIAYCSGWRFF